MAMLVLPVMAASACRTALRAGPDSNVVSVDVRLVGLADSNKSRTDLACCGAVFGGVGFFRYHAAEGALDEFPGVIGADRLGRETQIKGHCRTQK